MSKHESTKRHASDSVTSDAFNEHKKRRGVVKVVESDPQFTMPNNRAYFCDISHAHKYSRGSDTKVWFAHEANDGQVHRWIARVAHVVARGHGCAVCSGRQVQRGINDVATTDKRFATPNSNAYFEDYADAFKYTRGSRYKVCFAHTVYDGQVHRWIARVADVVSYGQGCAVCHGQ